MSIAHRRRMDMKEEGIRCIYTVSLCIFSRCMYVSLFGGVILVVFQSLFEVRRLGIFRLVVLILLYMMNNFRLLWMIDDDEWM